MNLNSGNDGSDSAPSSPSKMKWKKRHARGRNAQHNNTAKSTIATSSNKNSSQDKSKETKSSSTQSSGIKKPFPLNIEALNSCVNLPAGLEAQLKFANEQRARLDQLQQRLNSAKADSKAAASITMNTINMMNMSTPSGKKMFGPARPPTQSRTVSMNLNTGEIKSVSNDDKNNKKSNSRDRKNDSMEGDSSSKNNRNDMNEANITANMFMNMNGMNFPPSLMESLDDLDMLSMVQNEVINQCFQNAQSVSKDKSDGSENNQANWSGKMMQQIFLNQMGSRTKNDDSKPSASSSKGNASNSDKRKKKSTQSSSSSDEPLSDEMKTLMKMFYDVVSQDPSFKEFESNYDETKKKKGSGDGFDFEAASACMKDNLAKMKKKGFNPTVSFQAEGKDGKKKGKKTSTSSRTISFQTSVGSTTPLPPNQFFSMTVRGGNNNMSKSEREAFKLARNLIPPLSDEWTPSRTDNRGKNHMSNPQQREDVDEEDDDCSIPDLVPMEEEPPVVTETDRKENWNEIRKMATSGNREKNESDRNTSIEADLSTLAAVELLREEEEAAAEKLEDEDKAKRAAKKREKKQRKKERARREAAIKEAEASLRKREKSIISWQSRIVTAFTGEEVKKVDSLISEHPFREDKLIEIDVDIIEYLDKKPISIEDEKRESMRWLLNACVVKNTPRDKSKAWLDARNHLCSFIAQMSFDIIIEFNKDSRSALHQACLTGDLSFVETIINENKKGVQGQCGNLGWSSLHYAAVGGQIEVVKLLLQHGCDPKLYSNPSLTSYKQ